MRQIALVTFALFLVSRASPAVDFATFEGWLADHADAPVDGLTPGHYGQDRVGDLAAYFPPGYIAALDFPELDLTIAETANYSAHPMYLGATTKFYGQASIDDEGHLHDYVAGKPFSDKQIRAAANGQAGYMVAWNQVHRWQNVGYRNEARITYVEPTADGSAGTVMDGMLGGGHVDRHLTMFYHRVYLSGSAALSDSDYRMDVDGSNKLLFKEYIEMLSPFDVAGLKLVVERPLDQSEGDQVNSYLPTERRVRRLSAKERADSWLGTNWTLDDFEGYSGLVMDNRWRLLGEKVIGHVASSREPVPQFHGPTSTIPLDDWQLRPCWVVEAVPRWDNHPYGRRVLFIDRDTGSIAMTLIFDRNGEMLKVFSTMYEYSDELENPPPALSTPRWKSSIAINLKDGTGNVATALGKTAFVDIKPSQVRRLFSVSNLGGGR